MTLATSQPVVAKMGAAATISADAPEAVRVKHFANRYNWVRMQRKSASERVREIAKEQKLARAAEFAAIAEERAELTRRKAALLEDHPDYTEAEDDRKGAAEGLRIILQEAQAAGLDVKAFKAAVELGDLDPIERAEYADKVDHYATHLLLWTMTSDT